MKKLHIVTLAIVALLAFASTSALAATGTISSTVNIECAAAVTGGHSLDFGLLSAPTNGSPDSWTISGNTGLVTHTGNGLHFDPATAMRGTFTLTGSEPITFTVAVTTPFNDPNLILSDPTVSQNSPVDPSPGTHECSTSGGIFIGGTLTVREAAIAGLHNDARITITANY